MTDILFECDRCDGPVMLKTGPGRRREFRQGITLQVPEDFPIATCAGCGETYLTTSQAQRLDDLLKDELAAECRELVASVRRDADLTQKEVELACGVTPTYLSHVLSGKKQPSATLLRLLEAFAIFPCEASRHVAGMPWRAVLPIPTESKARYPQVAFDFEVLSSRASAPALYLVSGNQEGSHTYSPSPSTKNLIASCMDPAA